MPHLTQPLTAPGIMGLMQAYPLTAAPLNALAEVLLRSNEELSPAERELIAAHVSNLNGCQFCANCHLNASLAHQQAAPRFIQTPLLSLPDEMELRPVMRPLLVIAAQVQRSGREVSPAHVEAARAQGATDRMIHDTVLIAAAFCMFNRYVDGLQTLAPTEVGFYAGVGHMLAHQGYVNSVN